MLSLDRNAGIKECETLIASAASPRSEDCQLRVATGITSSQIPGTQVALAQAIITWARGQSAPTLWSYSNGQDTSLENLSRRVFGYVALATSEDVLSADRRSSLAIKSFGVLNEIDRESKERFGKRGLVFFFGLRDDFPSTYTPQLYEGPDKIINEEGFYVLAGTLLDQVLIQRRHRSLIIRQHTIGGLLKELIYNTHEHARKTESDVVIKRSVRGLVIAHHSLSADLERKYIKEIPAFSKFISSYRTGFAENNEFIEISIFDSGPGLAARMGGRPTAAMQIMEEYELVKKCFFKHSTTKSRKSLMGTGLFRTLAMIKADGGLLKIRTGRLCLVKYFLPTQRNNMNLIEADFLLEDAYSDDGSLTVLAEATGLVVTVLLPLKAKS